MESSAAVKSTKESMDPLFHLVFDVYELIFQHFNNRDVLNASLVSRNWFEVTENSSKCGERLLVIMKTGACEVSSEHGSAIPIVRTYAKFIPYKFKTIADDFKSVRKYQRLRFGIFGDDIHFIIPDISNILRRWKLKEVYIDDVCFKDVEQMEDFLSTFASTVEILKVTRIGTMFDNPRNKKLAFPVIRHLIIQDNPEGTFFKDIADSCKTLESFSVSFSQHYFNYVRDRNHDAIKKILTCNDKLTDFRVAGSSIKELFSPEAFSSYRIRLKTLCINQIIQSELLANFLESQAETLEELLLQDREEPRALFGIILKLPKLKKIQLLIHDRPTAWAVDELLCQSSSIEEFALNFKANLALSPNVLERWMLSMPNLKKFYIYSLTNELLETLKIHSPQIEHLWVFKLIIKSLKDPNCLPNIKSFHCERPIEDELKLQIKAKSVESQTPFEKMLLPHAASKKIFGPPKRGEKYEWSFALPYPIS